MRSKHTTHTMLHLAALLMGLAAPVAARATETPALRLMNSMITGIDVPVGCVREFHEYERSPDGERSTVRTVRLEGRHVVSQKVEGGGGASESQWRYDWNGQVTERYDLHETGASARIRYRYENGVVNGYALGPSGGSTPRERFKVTYLGPGVPAIGSEERTLPDGSVCSATMRFDAQERLVYRSAQSCRSAALKPGGTARGGGAKLPFPPLPPPLPAPIPMPATAPPPAPLTAPGGGTPGEHWYIGDGRQRWNRMNEYVVEERTGTRSARLASIRTRTYQLCHETAVVGASDRACPSPAEGTGLEAP